MCFLGFFGGEREEMQFVFMGGVGDIGWVYLESYIIFSWRRRFFLCMDLTLGNETVGFLGISFCLFFLLQVGVYCFVGSRILVDFLLERVVGFVCINESTLFQVQEVIFVIFFLFSVARGQWFLGFCFFDQVRVVIIVIVL